ncbi:MAG: hypothetical protein ACC628_26555, partial [Pirellulaceae bacterium]
MPTLYVTEPRSTVRREGRSLVVTQNEVQHGIAELKTFMARIETEPGRDPLLGLEVGCAKVGVETPFVVRADHLYAFHPIPPVSIGTATKSLPDSCQGES